MKPKLRLPSPATVIALLALFVALGGTAYGLGRASVKSRHIAPDAVRARDLGPLKLRSARVRDTDTTANDGVFNLAYGRARCKRGEQLISGGVRLRDTGGVFFGPQRVSVVESSPAPRLRQWGVTLNSDLGGAAREKLVVFAYCLVR
jgi:hypothetical protein